MWLAFVAPVIFLLERTVLEVSPVRASKLQGVWWGLENVGLLYVELMVGARNIPYLHFSLPWVSPPTLDGV